MICNWCQDKPVQNAAEWLDDIPRNPAPCPRCGRTIYPNGRIVTENERIAEERRQRERANP